MDGMATQVETQTENNRQARGATAGFEVWPGKPSPLGATCKGQGANFALYSQHAERVELLFFDAPDAEAASHIIPITERTGPIWHCFVTNVSAGQLYGYRVYGPFAPAEG